LSPNILKAGGTWQGGKGLFYAPAEGVLQEKPEKKDLVGVLVGCMPPEAAKMLARRLRFD
jgi:hypothetical protein